MAECDDQAVKAPAVQCDLLIIGTGAAAMSAALTGSVLGLKVLMVEKEDQFGGASARSGGGLWIPNSKHAANAGASDSREAAILFLRNEAGDRVNVRAAEAFVDMAPEMVNFIERNSPVRFRYLRGMPDYHCDTPGGSVMGRNLAPENWDASALGPHLKRLRQPLRSTTFLGMQVGVHEVVKYVTAGRKLNSALYVAKCIFRRVLDQIWARRTMRLAGGNALVGGLAAAVFNNGVELWTSSPARKLIADSGGVTGAVVDTPTGLVQVSASHGVILATGGYPHDSRRRAELFPQGATAGEVWATLPDGNSGDGIRMGEEVGADFNSKMRFPVALSPITRLHSGEGLLETMPCFQHRGKPGIIAVTRSGKRFTNEGRSYHDVCAALIERTHGDPEAVAWLIFDHRFLRRWGVGPLPPAPLSNRRHLKSGYLKMGRTVLELAEKCGIDPRGLTATIDRYNAFAVLGEDPDFGRGSNPYDLAHGDAAHRPNPCIGPLNKPPYYAIRVFAGAVGTFSGLRADEHARALDPTGTPIRRLYVVGNDMASITGGDYIAGGCTLGPGMTFGYIAARHAVANSTAIHPEIADLSA